MMYIEFSVMLIYPHQHPPPFPCVKKTKITTHPYKLSTSTTYKKIPCWCPCLTKGSNSRCHILYFFQLFSLFSYQSSYCGFRYINSVCCHSSRGSCRGLVSIFVFIPKQTWFRGWQFYFSEII